MRNQSELNAALANSQVKTVKLFNSISGATFTANRLVDFDLNGKTLTGNVIINTTQNGTINLLAGTGGKIVGNLTVNAPNATVNNGVTVESGLITITDVAVGTWNENADNNKIVVNDSTGITLNIARGKKVESLTLNETATVTVGEGTTFSNPVVIKKDSTIISKEIVPAIV